MTTLLVSVGLVILAATVRRAVRWLDRPARPDPVVDRLIRPPVCLYSGLDDELRKRTAARRGRAETIAREARRVQTKDEERGRVRLVS